MFVWILLFLIVLAVSLILAIKSMDDYRAQPLNFGAVYSLFLIRKPDALTPKLLQQIYDQLSPERLIISFERLFKGPKKALVVYGPESVLHPFFHDLDLLELEDYSQKIYIPYFIWGVGKKKPDEPLTLPGQLFSNLPDISADEQFWWQVVLQPKSDGGNFQAVIRAIVLAGDRTNAKNLQDNLIGIGSKDGLLTLPLKQSPEQLVKFYQERSIPADDLKSGTSVVLNIDAVPALLGVN